MIINTSTVIAKWKSTLQWRRNSNFDSNSDTDTDTDTDAETNASTNSTIDYQVQAHHMVDASNGICEWIILWERIRMGNGLASVM